MANSDKNIVITPFIGSTTADPQIVFSGASSTLGPQNIAVKVYPTSNGTLSFEGSAGQLFSITNSLSGTIFSVNDVSGMPSIEVLDTGLIKLAQYSGNVLVGTGTDNGVDKLQVNGTVLATTFNGALAGNATTATTLQTARTIGGVSFNGSANINLPGVNTAGNQNTSGTAAGLSATLVATSGGTGQSSYAVGDILFASTTTALSKLADVATGSALISGGIGVAPSYGKIGLTTHVSGTLPVANGGTGITSLGAGIATFLGTPSSANLLAAVTDETGTGALVFATSPTLVTPALGTPSSGTLTNCTFPTLNQNTTGSAATLTTARTIGGVSFNGSANIDLPGVNTAGNQNTSGNAATATNVAWSGVTSTPTTLAGYSVTQLAVAPSTSAVNADTFEKTGIHYVASLSLLGQTDGALYANAYSTAWQHQIFGDYRTGQLVVRGKNNGTFGAWRTVLDSSNFNSYAPTLTGTGASGSWGISVTGSSASTTGNAATATALQNARTIGGVSFNGTANINLPGVNTAGNQNTTGSAATLTTARTIGGVSFNGSANINLPGVNTAGNQNTTGSAATLTTTRAINGVNFNGSAAITVPGNFTNRTTSESGHAIFISTTATGNQSMFTNTSYRFNPSTAELSATNFNSTSDINKKHNIETIEGALDIVNKLRGVRFNWNHNDQPGIGVVAQEIEQYVPEVVVSLEDSKTVQYGNLIGLLIEAIKELSAQIEAQKHPT